MVKQSKPDNKMIQQNGPQFGVSVAIMNGEVTSETSLLPGEGYVNVMIRAPSLKDSQDASFSKSVPGICSASLERQNLALSGWHTVGSTYFSESSCFQVICHPHYPPLNLGTRRSKSIRLNLFRDLSVFKHLFSCWHWYRRAGSGRV